MFGSPLDHHWDIFAVTLGSPLGHFEMALGTLSGHLGVTFGTPSGSLRGHFGVTLVPLWGHFGVTPGSLWGHFGVTFGARWEHFGDMFFIYGVSLSWQASASGRRTPGRSSSPCGRSRVQLSGRGPLVVAGGGRV